MACFFVDYENTKSQGLAGMSKLRERDVLVVWLGRTNDAKKVQEEIESSGFRGRLELKKNAAQTINALDYNLVFSLQVYATRRNRIFIISEDRDYDLVFPQMRGLGWKVERHPTIADAVKSRIIYVNLEVDERSVLEQFLRAGETFKNRSDINAYLCPRMGANNVSQLFKKLKAIMAG